MKLKKVVILLAFFLFFAGSLLASNVATILNYPNPFAPPAQSTTIYYSLNNDANVRIYIFDITNQLVKRFNFSSGSSGGIQGTNVATWDGISDFGDVVSNDVYICNVVADGALIGRCKIAVVK